MIRVIQKHTKDLIRSISEELGMSTNVITNIVDSQFEFVKEKMSEGVPGDKSTFRNIQLRYLGTFGLFESKHDAIGRNIKNHEEHT